MREIKFRAWSPSAKNMYTPNYVCGYGNLEVLPSCVDSPDDYTDAILMQFTGLKDKNGQEIYEGDIVEIPYQTDDIECIQRVVFWDDARACFSTAHEEDDYDDLMDKGIKVIGNIYENPEILKDGSK